jgi:meiotic recombination protein SPO11
LSPLHLKACFLRVVELVLDGLIEDVIATKRDIYYRDVSLFRKQQTVDTVKLISLSSIANLRSSFVPPRLQQIIEDLAASLMVRRSDLNVVATSKGLFSGGLTLHMKDGSEKKGSTEVSSEILPVFGGQS